MSQVKHDNPAIQNLFDRRSFRSYTAEAVKDEDLRTVVLAGEYAASGSGKQSPRFVVVTKAETREALRKMNAAVMGQPDADPYYGAPCIVLVFADAGRSTGFEDACLALGNMMNAAAALGLGSCWIHREKEMFQTPEGRELMAKWGLGAEFYGVGACIVGHPAAAAGEPPARKADYAVWD